MALRLLIHAPTVAALARARSNARNLLRADPTAEVEIVVNGGAVAAAIETGEVEPQLLRKRWFLPIAQARIGRSFAV
jgi:NitT/TauT family transport system ATP-binding protein